MSDSLRLRRGNERRERVAHFAHFWTKNKQFARKSKEGIPSPVSIQSVHAVIGPNSCYVTFFHERDHVQKTQIILVDIE